jgi:hypothetical protein
VLLSPIPDPAVAPDAEFREIFDVTVPTQALSLSKRPDEVYDYRLRLFLGHRLSRGCGQRVRRGLPDRTL